MIYDQELQHSLKKYISAINTLILGHYGVPSIDCRSNRHFPAGLSFKLIKETMSQIIICLFIHQLSALRQKPRSLHSRLITNSIKAGLRMNRESWDKIHKERRREITRSR